LASTDKYTKMSGQNMFRLVAIATRPPMLLPALF
jgi:hypothetical protein